MKIILSLILTFTLTCSSSISQSYIGSFDLVASQNYTNGNIQRDTISYYFGNEKTAILIHGRGESQNMRMVFSTSDTIITSLFEINGKKGGFILPMNDDYWPGISHALRPYDKGPRKELNYTGKEKHIEGFTCREVLAENEDFNVVLWVAEDIPLSMTQVFSYQSVGKGKTIKEMEMLDKFGLKGLSLELILKSKQGGADVTIQLMNFTETFDENIFSTDGYELIEVE